MTSALDMSLDDIIKSNKKSAKPNSRGKGGHSSGLGVARRSFKRAANRVMPYTKTQSTPASSIETGTELRISNLDYGVSNDDIGNLFSEIGDLKRHAVHFDRSGRSKGTAEVVFSRRVDAIMAVKKFNNVQLDGKPMKIEIMGTNIQAPAAAPPSIKGTYVSQNGASIRLQRRGDAVGRPHHSGRGKPRHGGRGVSRGRGRGRGRGKKAPLSIEDLDADLEKYHEGGKQSDAMVH